MTVTSTRPSFHPGTALPGVNRRLRPPHGGLVAWRSGRVGPPLDHTRPSPHDKARGPRLRGGPSAVGICGSRLTDSPGGRLSGRVMEGSHEEPVVWAGLRSRQEESVALDHQLTEMEFALAREAAAVGRVFALAGVPFDARTFVGLRLVEVSVLESVEPLDVLRELVDRGALDRSASIADAILDGSD